MVKKTFLNAFLAGLMISIGGTVYLALSSSGELLPKIIGAFFFSVGLLCICIFKMYLYTGKVCYLVEDHTKENVLTVLLGILGNFVGTTLFGIATGYAQPSLNEFAEKLCEAKLNLNLFAVLFLAFLCGILIYVAVEIFRQKSSSIGILLAIPVFILCSYEHSIADMFYFATARVFSFESTIFLLVVILGNALGGTFIPFIQKFTK